MHTFTYGLPRWHTDKESTCKAGNTGSIPGSGRSPGEGNEWQPTPVFLPGKSYRLKSLAGHSLCNHKRVGHNLATKQQIYICMYVYI